MSSTPPRRKVLVIAPPYQDQSAGIRVLHTLCNELNLCGVDAYLVFYKFKSTPGADFFITEDAKFYSDKFPAIKKLPESTSPEQLKALVQDAYVIYPEVIQGNPLQARHVVRYVLNTEVANGYAMLHDPKDLIVCFASTYWPTPTPLMTLLVDEPIFNEAGTLPTEMRQMDCTYIGKGADFGGCFKIPGTVMIERKWPADKESLALMLRNTRYLFTWDLVTQTNYDAVRCGAIPIVVRWHPYTPAIMQTSMGEVPHGELAVVDGQAQIVLDREDYQRKKAAFLANYANIAVDNRKRVEAFIGEMDAHFGNAR